MAREFSASTDREVEKLVLDIWCFYRVINAGDVVVDVGAGVGTDVVALSGMAGPSGKVIAIEAHPTTFRCLQKTIQANRLKNVVALNIAVGDRRGRAQIEDGAAHIANRSGRGEIQVEMLPLDDILNDYSRTRPLVIKMNIEGAEVAALAGASRVLRGDAHWVVSCHDFLAHKPGYENSATRAEVTQRLKQAGFSLHPARSTDPRPWIRDYVYASR